MKVFLLRCLIPLFLLTIVISTLSSCSTSSSSAQSIQDVYNQMKQSGGLPVKVTIFGDKYYQGDFTYDTPWGKREDVVFRDGSHHHLILFDTKDHEYQAVIDYVQEDGAEVVGAPMNTRFVTDGTAYYISEADSQQVSRGVKFYGVFINNATIRKH